MSETARKTVVYTTNVGWSDRRRYVLIRRGDAWLVDNIQVYDDHEGTWIREIL